MEKDTPLPPFAALRRGSGNRRNSCRIRRVDGEAQMLCDQPVRGGTRMHRVAGKRRPEGQPERRIAWLQERRERTNRRRNGAQRIERRVRIEIRPPRALAWPEMYVLYAVTAA